jgi:hypothetical protein
MAQLFILGTSMVRRYKFLPTWRFPWRSPPDFSNPLSRNCSLDLNLLPSSLGRILYSSTLISQSMSWTLCVSLPTHSKHSLNLQSLNRTSNFPFCSPLLSSSKTHLKIPSPFLRVTRHRNHTQHPIIIILAPILSITILLPSLPRASAIRSKHSPLPHYLFYSFSPVLLSVLHPLDLPFFGFWLAIVHCS